MICFLVNKIRYVFYYKFVKNRIADKNKLSSQPYLSGDTFRDLCHIIIEENDIKINHTRINNLIFFDLSSNDHCLSINSFFNKNYILILHNGDKTFLMTQIKYLSKKFQRIYSVNLVSEEDNVHAIPLGLENRRHNINGKIEKLCKFVEKSDETKKKKKKIILMNFRTETNPSKRIQIMEELSKDKKIKVKKCLINPWSEMIKFEYMICPEGNGFDTHRFWECIYLGVIPIVERSQIPSSFYDLPVLIVDNYEDLKTYDREFLIKKKEECNTKHKHKAYLDYWTEKIGI